MTLLDELRNLKTQQPDVLTQQHGIHQHDQGVYLRYTLTGPTVLMVRHDPDGRWALGIVHPNVPPFLPNWWEYADNWEATTNNIATILADTEVGNAVEAYIFAELAISEFRDHLASLGWLVTLIREMGS